MRKLGILVIFLGCAGAAFGIWLHHELYSSYKGYAAPFEFVDIPRGTSRHEIAELLETQGVVRNALAFELYSRWHTRQTLQAGEYDFDHPMNPREVFGMIAAGKIYVHEVQVLEGWTMFDIADELARDGLCSRDDFLAAARDPSLVRDLAPDAQTLEGYLFPATYEFTRHTSCSEIATAMVEHFRAVWTRISSRNGDAPEQSPENVVSLASLVERETPLASERPLIAGVFTNRMRKGLPLQCDPTVQYALALAGHPARSITAEDLKIRSPYNTYLQPGLPPGPIANPGEVALAAALAPEKTQYFYFVANNEGGHFFSSTLAEHNRNVARYRRRLAGLPDTPAPAARRAKGHRRNQ
ncbi:MAG: endolytic transglycosylase MltG [Candidatus Acidiferrales bacterium]